MIYLFLKIDVVPFSRLSFTQESGEFAEGLSAWSVPLRVSALPARRPAEGPDPDSALRPFSSIRSICPSLPPSPLFLRLLLTRPYSRPRSASHHGTVSNPDVPAEPQHSRARLPSPNPGSDLPQPQPDTTAAMAVAPPSSFCTENNTKKIVVPLLLEMLKEHAEREKRLQARFGDV